MRMWKFDNTQWEVYTCEICIKTPTDRTRINSDYNYSTCIYLNAYYVFQILTFFISVQVKLN